MSKEVKIMKITEDVLYKLKLKSLSNAVEELIKLREVNISSDIKKEI